MYNDLLKLILVIYQQQIFTKNIKDLKDVSVFLLMLFIELHKYGLLSHYI